MIEERKLKRPGLVRVFDPGEMGEIHPAQCRLYWMHAKELCCRRLAFRSKLCATGSNAVGDPTGQLVSY
jgi:hypothetical protein